MNPVVRMDRTSCAIACVAEMMGMSHSDMKSLARSIGVTPEDNALWTSTLPIRRLLAYGGLQAGPEELPFTLWERLPDWALLSIRWKIQDGNPSWH
jgi:hypothetical protein